MDSRIASVEFAVVHCEAVWITGIWEEVHYFLYFAGGGIVADQARTVFAIPVAVVPDLQPDRSVVPGKKSSPIPSTL